MTFTLTGEQLYDLVWSEPMQRLAEQSGISDVAIAKHCHKLGLPVPERGYWNKLQVMRAGDEETHAPEIFVGLRQSVRRKIVIEAKQTAGLRETAHARGTQTGRKSKSRRKT